MANIEELFESFNDDYLNFDKVKNKRSQRPDLHAFIVLSELFSGDRDIVSGARHEEIFLDFDYEQLITLSPQVVLELVRSGVRYDSERESLVMFV